jgi:hypothetical protein
MLPSCDACINSYWCNNTPGYKEMIECNELNQYQPTKTALEDELKQAMELFKKIKVNIEKKFPNLTLLECTIHSQIKQYLED